MSQLKVIAVSDLRTAKDGRNYFIATFRPGFGQRSVKRTFWEQYERDAKTGEQLKTKYWERASHEEALELLKSGELIVGEKVTATVQPYLVGDNEVSTYSTVIFPDENAQRVFERQNHPMLDEETGELIIFRKKAVLSTSKEEEPAMV